VRQTSTSIVATAEDVALDVVLDKHAAMDNVLEDVEKDSETATMMESVKQTSSTMMKTAEDVTLSVNRIRFVSVESADVMMDFLTATRILDAKSTETTIPITVAHV